MTEDEMLEWAKRTDPDSHWETRDGYRMLVTRAVPTDTAYMINLDDIQVIADVADD